MVPGFSPKNLGYFQNTFFNINENKIEINFIFLILLPYCLFYLEISIATRQVHKRFVKLPIALSFWHATCYTILDLHFLYFSEVLDFLDYGLSLAKARDKIKSKKAWTFSIKRKFLSKNFITLRTKITVL